MTEENNESIQTEAPQAEESASQEAVQLNHIYYEIESDLLAKPNSLVDLIITAQVPTVIFCNQPSEADLVEVVLTKRQVSCRKLIGRVPGAKVAQAANQVTSGEINALIVTDISARDLDLGQFEHLVNYAIHDDPEVYIHRCSVSGDDLKLSTVISLVSPLDHGNFHYLKKVVDFEIKAQELPKQEDIQAAQFDNLVKEATGFKYPEKLDIDALIEQIKASDAYEDLLKYFIYNTVYVVPELKASSGGRRSDSRDRRSTDKRLDGEDFNEEESRILNRNIPKKEYIRFYLGVGSDSDYSKDKVTSLLNEAANLPEDQICNFIDRGNYSFIDVLKANAAGLTEIMDGYQIDGGEQLVFKKATMIVANVDETPGATKEAPAAEEEE